MTTKALFQLCQFLNKFEFELFRLDPAATVRTSPNTSHESFFLNFPTREFIVFDSWKVHEIN